MRQPLSLLQGGKWTNSAFQVHLTKGPFQYCRLSLECINPTPVSFPGWEMDSPRAIWAPYFSLKLWEEKKTHVEPSDGCDVGRGSPREHSWN